MTQAILVSMLLIVNTATNLTGQWSGHFRVDGGDHDVPQLFSLKQVGDKISGSGGPDETEQYPLEKGTLDGDRLQFEVTTGEWKFVYDLKVDGTRISGTLELKSVNDRRTGRVSLTRQ